MSCAPPFVRCNDEIRNDPNDMKRNEMNMKTMIGSVGATLLLASAVCLKAEEAAQIPAKAPAGSAEFERLKSLVGTWQGKVDIGQGLVDMTTQYRLLAGGTVLEERVFAGTPNEMITMFYDKDGKLALTHYCVLGNRPGMILKSADDKTMKFAFDESCGINTSKESHMHALTLRFDDANTLTATCKAFINGQETPEKPATLKRSATPAI
jgi:hypothetical protein